ncbi:MAG: YihY/virulence factor BrkB family protein [Burkholderiales bacterium]|nr:YihY/virulence factor BrkB family protein [Burkholderiales bacterium]
MTAFQPFTRALRLWSGAGGLTMSAAMSFYGILSLAPLLLALVGLLGWWVDRDMLESGLITQVEAVVGQQGSSLIRAALASAQAPGEGIAASVFGFAVLLFGATGVFGQLQDALTRLWSQGQDPVKTKWWRMAALRLRGIGYILVFGFLLLVSLVVSALLAMFSGWLGGGAALEAVVRVVNELIGLVVGALLFFGLMRLSPGARPRTLDLAVGAFVGSILFTGGRQLLALYLSKAAVVSAYGAAGSLVVLLMWIYFSSAVLLFGACFARALAEARGQSSERRWAPHSASAASTPATSITTKPQR